MRHLSESAARISGKCFERKYIALGRIIKQWDEIIGKNFADKAVPVKIRHFKPKKKGEKAKSTLDIAVSSAHATALHYQKDLILERINRIFGEQWVSSIRFVHMPTNMNTPFSMRKKNTAPLTSEEKKTLSGMLTRVEDDAIQQRLLSLGEAILLDNKS